MYELKAHKAYNRWIDEEMPTPNDDLICNEVYLKSESDKVIAELEESHKKEVEQLLIETKRLENLCASYRHDCDNLAIREANALKEIGRDNRVIRHQKYKRCLATANWCAAECVVNQNTYKKYFTHKSEFRIEHFRKWYFRLLKLAEQFKEEK